jgi:hypothetical protein
VLRYDEHPTAIRLLALLGGLGMTVGAFLAWSITYDFVGKPYREIGVSTSLGIIALIAGIATLVFVAVPRLLPLAIATGLVGGAAAGLYMIDALPLNLPDAATQLGLGLIGTLGCAALTGAAGIAALSVAAAVKQTSERR